MIGYIVTQPSSSQIEVKKSVFIGSVCEVHTEEEALAFIEELRKKHRDARHHCYAYVLGEKNEICRFSDDKEPQGTAGKPILETITAGDFRNTVVVVTRYFGGILLGTGGLTRAYREAASCALTESVHVPVEKGCLLQIECGYTLVGKLQYLFNQLELSVLDTVYDADVTFTVAVPEEKEAPALSKITEAANGAASVAIVERTYFLNDGGDSRPYRF